MQWLKRDIWKACIAFAVLLLLFVLMVCVPMLANAYEGTSGLAISGPMQTTPTVDLTVTALAKEQLALQVRQLQNQSNWLANNSTALIAAITAIVVAIIGLYQWRGNRNAERKKEIAAQDKELRDRAEERFKTAVAAMGDEKESVQVGGAILLRSFLNKEDEKIYGRYYMQIFDLAVAYLRLSNTPRSPEDLDGLPPPSLDTNASLPLTPLRNALIVVFKESFPLVRKRLDQKKLRLEIFVLDASQIRLDRAFLPNSDLSHIRMIEASLRETFLSQANLSDAALGGSDLRAADLSGANLNNASLFGANLSEANLHMANLEGADLQEADLSNVIIEHARSLVYADLRDVKGLTEKQLLICKARGAITDAEDFLSTSPRIDRYPYNPRLDRFENI